MKTLLTEKMETHSYPGTPFTIEMTPVDHGQGYWGTWEVNVLKEGISIGNYERSYHGFVAKTFCPFQMNGVWYALYSANYTTTRVARLTDQFEDWCGETGHSFGFCPTEFYVPAFFKYEYDSIYSDKTTIRSNTCYFDDSYENYEEYCEDLLSAKEDSSNRDFQTGFTDWALLSGCVWGDDSSWKVRYIDLSKIEDKQLKITDKFGYYPLPDGKSLRQACEIIGKSYLRLDTTNFFNLNKDYEVDIQEIEPELKQ